MNVMTALKLIIDHDFEQSGFNETKVIMNLIKNVGNAYKKICDTQKVVSFESGYLLAKNITEPKEIYRPSVFC